MDILQPIVVTRLIFILGIINLVTGVLVLSTCRCIPGSKITKITGNLMKYRVYQHFFKYHCYIWWVFWSSVVVHAVLAISFIGVPF